MSAELPSTEQIFTETSRLVPLKTDNSPFEGDVILALQGNLIYIFCIREIC